ncbi:unnamed protein product [Schistosoma rodhaini]|uniref:COX6C domain-containing protein n=1 Tax=Schistosoma rodhaini TaxID=6188 RepID=A0A183R8K1_9TREM|nr:unnamed protein product [Schistosoma rodhaini]
MSNRPIWLRGVLFIGTIIASAYYLTYIRYYAYEKKRLATQTPHLDEDYILEFYKEVAESSRKTEWTNKRVNRPWGE